MLFENVAGKVQHNTVYTRSRRNFVEHCLRALLHLRAMQHFAHALGIQTVANLRH